MTTLRVGTRGSELALWQTRWVVERLRAAHPSLSVEEVIIKTHGDLATEPARGGFGEDWPVGAFVSAIERVLADDPPGADFAVHSYKDLPTAAAPGLLIAAVPQREVVHDVLVTKEPIDSLRDFPRGFKLGTSSPRRAAQFRRLGDVEVVPIRGNVTTRVAKIERENLDGVVLAAAGLARLGLNPPHLIDLPTDCFVPSPAQGALAVQTRSSGAAAEFVKVLDHEPSRRAVEAERSFLEAVSAGCRTPVGALATIDGTTVSLRGQLFSEDGQRMVEGVEVDDEPQKVGERLGRRLIRELSEPRR